MADAGSVERRKDMTKREARQDIRSRLLEEIAARLAVEPQADVQDETVLELWKEEVDRMGRRLAALYGLDYPERV